MAEGGYPSGHAGRVGSRLGYGTGPGGGAGRFGSAPLLAGIINAWFCPLRKTVDTAQAATVAGGSSAQGHYACASDAWRPLCPRFPDWPWP